VFLITLHLYQLIRPFIDSRDSICANGAFFPFVVFLEPMGVFAVQNFLKWKEEIKLRNVADTEFKKLVAMQL